MLKPSLEDVVQVNDSDRRFTLEIEHEQRCDRPGSILFHSRKCFGSKRIFGDSSRCQRHHLLCAFAEYFSTVRLQTAAQIAVRYNADEVSLFVNNPRDAEPLVGYFEERFLDRRIKADDWQFAAPMHQIFHPQ